MFDINDPMLTSVDKKNTPIDRLPTGTADAQVDPQRDAETEAAHPFDAPDMEERHRLVLSYYRQELDRQVENRMQMATDEDYYDNIQWTEEEAQILRERGQAAMVYNVISQSVNWIIGSEKKGRSDFAVLPRNKQEAKPAELKSKLMKYLSDVNRLPFHKSRAFEDAVKVGIGWLEDGAQDEDDGEQLYSRYESWRNMLWDSSSTEMDLSDCRYVFRSKWVDTDVAMALFQDRAAVIENSMIEESHYSSFDLDDGDLAMDYAEFERENHGISRNIVTSRRRRVRLIEAQYRIPERVKKLRGGAFNGDVYNEQNPHPSHDLAVKMGHSDVVEKVMMRVHVMILTVNGVLYEGVLPYRHNRFSFTPIWGFRRGRDGLPYGVIRGMRDIQDDINKSASKSLHILSSNKTIMDEGTLPEDWTLEDYAEEIARPDAIIVKRTGKELIINADRDLSAAHENRMSRSIQMIQQVGGVTDELMGRSTNAVSGVAVQARQEQGTVATNKLFDNLLLASQIQGENQLSLIEQYYTDAKQFRITNDRGTPDYHAVNDGLPENDITRTKADFIISQQDWRATMRQAASEQLSNMLMKMPPQVALVLLDLVVDSMDIPNRDEIVKRIRQINGQKDPDQQEPTPEDLQKQQAAQEAEAYQKQMAMAQLDELQAKTEKTRAEAGRINKLMVGDAMLAADTAMDAATKILAMPTIAKVADNLLQEGGWTENPAIRGLPAPVAPQQVAPQPGGAMPQAVQPPVNAPDAPVVQGGPQLPPVQQ